MLICPQCHFENPNSNNFCQRCGTSLVNKACPECGTTVAVNIEQCPNCGTLTGKVWRAIITTMQQQEVALQAEVETEEEISSELPLVSSPSSTTSVSPGEYLDQQQRYQLLEALPSPETTASSEIEVKVLDCQPFTLTPLETNTDSVVENVPAIAKTYLALQSQLSQQLPAIHDAWQIDDKQVVLIADCSNLPQILDWWSNDQISHKQILHWLYQMSKLWAVLEPWHCRQSLLELSNLRLNQNGTIVLLRLYPEASEAEKSLTLQDLARIWLKLFQESQRTYFGSMVQMLNDLQSGSIQTVSSLQSRLKQLAAELQPKPNPVELPPIPPPPAATPATVTSGSTTVLQIDPPAPNTQQLGDDSPTIVLPMQLYNLADAGRTDVGRQRHHNEDCFGIATTINKLELPKGRTMQARGLYILCDGMGGHAKGEVASSLAVKTLQQYFHTHWQAQQLPTQEQIREAIRLANQTIYEENQQDSRSGVGRMGTTLVIVLLQDTQVAVAHVGDSRLYRLSRKGELEQVTVDHEVGQREIARGVEPEVAYARPDAYQLTQALGPRDENFINPDIKFLELNEDTLLLLASDGLCDNNLLEQNWQTHLEPLLSSGANLEQGVSDLIDLANQYNGHDNITAILIRAKVRPNLEPQPRV